jgi:hypothetical protein
MALAFQAAEIRACLRAKKMPTAYKTQPWFPYNRRDNHFHDNDVLLYAAGLSFNIAPTNIQKNSKIPKNNLYIILIYFY